ncbi:hypothetical protein ACVIHH_007095 [Bradyrhizobium sp. USDA 4518]|nr:hypothetical protein [Bradyrhizobium sp. USDA 4541]MCP1910679.1 hypothetical protein [Bradyrhizobium elkanii]
MSSAFKEGAAEIAPKDSLFSLRSSRWRKPLRLRGKGPSWAGLALLVLAADIVLAATVWQAVNFFRH